VLAILAAGLALVTPAAIHDVRPAQGPPTVYVDVDGRGGACSDARGAAEAQNPATPVCTIDRGIDIAPSGATVRVRGGNYGEVTASGGSRTGLVTVAAQPGESVSLPNVSIENDASFLRFEGLHLTGGSDVTFRVEEGDSHDIQLVGSDVLSDAGDAVDLRWGASGILIEGNRINSRPGGAGGGGNGISLTSTTRRPGVPDPGATVHPPVRNVVIRNNYFESIGTDAIRPANFDNLVVEGNEITGVNENGSHNDVMQTVWGGDHFIFRNNYVHDNEGQGFFIKDGEVTDVDFVNNVFVRNTGNGYQFNVYDTIGLRVLNNTIWDNQANMILRNGLRNVVMRNNLIQRLDSAASDGAELRASWSEDHNLIGGSTSWSFRGPHDLSGSPAFVNAGARDYRLTAASAGVDAGSADGAPPVDKACRARFDAAAPNTGAGSPAFVDMGALEFNPASEPGDTAARWRADCSGPAVPPGGTGSLRPSLRLLSVRARGRSLAVRVRARNACRLRASARGRWHAHGHAHARRLKPARKRLSGGAAAATLRLRFPRTIRARLSHHRRVSVRLAVTASGCSGGSRTIRRTKRLRGH
jgi:Right handed beta helix region